MNSNLTNILACPECLERLHITNSDMICKKCNLAYNIRENKPFFLKDFTKDEESAVESLKGDLNKDSIILRVIKKIHPIISAPDTHYHNKKIKKLMKSIIQNKKNILN